MQRRIATIVVAIAVLCVAVIVWRFVRSGDGTDLHLAIRQLSCRPLEARLSGLPYAPPTGASDGGGFAELDIRERARRASIAWRSENPVARLVMLGDWDGAKRQLERRTSRNDATASTWSDYAAVLHDTAAPGDAFTLTLALAAADHALEIEPFLPEALFNRGVILETLSFRTAAAKAYGDYLWVDRASQWSAEVRDRLSKLRLSQPSSRLSVDLADLRSAVASHDVLFITDATIASPEQMRPFAEQALLQWGERMLAHDEANAAELLEVVRVLGALFERQWGDALLAETVRAIDAASDPAKLARAHVALGEAREVTLHAVTQGELRQASLDHPLIAAQFATCPCTRMRYGEVLDVLRHHVAHSDGRMPPFRSAAARLREAERLFDAQGSPMALVARYNAAGAEAFASTDLRRDVIDELSRRTPPRYRLLTAHMESLRARAFVRDGLVREALTSLHSARDAYEQLGEEWQTNRTRDALAAIYSSVGDTAHAWRLRSETFQWISQRQDDRQLAYGIYYAASDALRGNRFDLAHSLLNVVVDFEVFDRIGDEALIWRAAAASRAGLRRTARGHLDSAQRVLRVRTDRRADLMAELSIAAAWIKGSAEPAMLSFEHLIQSERDRHAEGGPLALRVLAIPSVRQFFLTQPFDTYRLLAAEQDRAGQPLEAIRSLDRYRLQDRSSDAFRSVREQWYQAIPSDTVLISYGVFARQLVIYAAHSNGVERATIASSPSDVERLTVSFSHALQNRDDRVSRIAGKALYRILMAPVANIVAKAHSIVVVPDPSMRQIPFAALVHSNGRYLIQDHAVVVVPSIASYLKSPRKRRAISRAILAVGNPLLNEGLRALGSLRGAEAEAQEIAAMYPSRALLVRNDATKHRVVTALASCDVAHFAVHAAVALNDVNPPHLLLSESGEDDGRLSAPEVAELRLGGVRTVVLAGCRTAVATPRRPETRSLVEAFLTAGAGSVIGALWEVDDGVTREMSIQIHRALRSGETPAAALRTAQLRMIDSKAKARSPSDWAALQLYGSGH